MQITTIGLDLAKMSFRSMESTRQAMTTDGRRGGCGSAGSR